MRILLVEDDVDLCRAVEAHLHREGYVVDFCHNGEDALDFALAQAHDLIVLDRMLPGRDGLCVLRILRAKGIATPVLMVTAMNGVRDRVDGLDAGADDYLVKPFAVEELLARIRALARRPAQWESARSLAFADIALDSEKRVVTGPLAQKTLSKREAQLLEVLLRNPAQVLPRNLLLARVWGPGAPVEDGNLDNYILFLRRRLKSVGSAAKIVTVHAVGYRLEAAC